ncbi:MAG TPA: hypothetical protein V6D11_29970 [Waterburya sp.]|jgi:hypothetical protein
MSQNVSTNPKEREPLSAPTSIQPWSAEAEADKLMDELFGDIDNILEGSSRLPTEPAKPEYVSLKSIVIPQITKPGATSLPQKRQEQASSEPTDSDALANLPESAPLSQTTETQVAPLANSRPNQSSVPWERLLLMLGLASVGVAAIVVLMTQRKLTWPWSPKPAAPPTVTGKQVSSSDAQFAEYMRRALDTIDKKTTKTNPQKMLSAAGPNLPNQLSMSGPSNRVSASNAPQRVVERVYIPVYPPQNSVAQPGSPSVARSPVPTFSALPTLPTVKPSVSLPSVRRVAPAPSPALKRSTPAPSPTLKRSAPAPSPIARRSASASPQAAASAPVRTVPTASSSVPIPPSAVAQSPTSASKYTFVGFWGLGDQPAALFQAGGVVQRIHVGEAVGDSGWTLVSVAEQEAVIRRNGEVRSVFAGQTF